MLQEELRHARPSDVWGGWFRCEWNPHEDRRPPTKSCIDVERAATQTGALPHADQAKAVILRALWLLRHVEAATIVLDDDHGLIVARLQQYADVRRAGVLHKDVA